MQLVSVWSDLYASTLALYTGQAGGHRWLVAATPQDAAGLTATFSALEGKGELLLLVYQGLTPLEAALKEHSDPVLGRALAGVIVISQHILINQHLAGGSEVEIAPVKMQVQPGGLSYLEGGSYPAWTDALGSDGPSGECPAASVCAHLGLPVRVCAPEALEATLKQWWAATPHAQISASAELRG
jgi:hypothetical protein